MKKKLMFSFLVVLIGIAFTVMPVFAADNYKFSSVKETSWKCNGVQYKVKWKKNYYTVYKYDPQTGDWDSYTPLNWKIPKNMDSWASVEEVKPDTGLVYINVDRLYSDSIFCYDLSDDSTFLAAKGAQILLKTGDTYFVSSSRTPTDMSPRDYSIYRYTSDGCEKVRKLTNKGLGVRYINGKLYYTNYPLSMYSYGVKVPDMHKMQIFRINVDGTHKKLLKTVNGGKGGNSVYLGYTKNGTVAMGAHSAKIKIEGVTRTKTITVKY